MVEVFTSEEQRRRESGRRIRDLRMHALGLTQAELGGLIGMHPRSIGRWESGLQEPEARTWRKLSEVLGKPVSYLSAFDFDQGGPNGEG